MVKIKQFELSLLEKDALREIISIGASNSASALSKMVNYAVDLKINFADTILLTAIPNLLEDKEMRVTAVYMSIKGQIIGTFLLIYPMHSALLLVDLIMKRKLGSTKKLSEMDKSALMEIANIVSGNCTTAMSKFLEVSFQAGIPYLSKDMVGSIVEHIITKSDNKEERVLASEVEFNISSNVSVSAFMLMLFDISEVERLRNFIRVKTGDKQSHLSK